MSSRFIIIICIISTSLCSCTSGEDFIGKWNIVSFSLLENIDVENSYMEFSEDGFMNVSINNKKARGKWVIDEDKKNVYFYVFDNFDIKGNYTLENHKFIVNGEIGSKNIYIELDNKHKTYGVDEKNSSSRKKQKNTTLFFLGDKVYDNLNYILIKNHRIEKEIIEKEKSTNILIKYKGYIDEKYAITMFLDNNNNGYYYYDKFRTPIKIQGESDIDAYVLKSYINEKLNDIFEYSKQANSLNGYWYNENKTKKLSFRVKKVN